MTGLKLLLPDSLKNWLNRRNFDFNKFDSLKSKSIWFHASSGEVEYVKNIITQIKKNNPNQKIVLSYSSPSIEKLLANIKHDLDLIVPLPWDQPGPIKKLIALLNPGTLVFAKTDFWPELIYQAKRANVRCGVVSFALNLKLKPSFSQYWALQQFDFIFTSDDSTSKKLKNLGIESTVAADTRFDQVFFRLAQPSRFQYLFKKPLITFGSTWPEDDQVLIETLPSILNKGFQVVWCPHDVSAGSLQTLKNKIKNFDFTVLSSIQQSSEMNSEIQNEILVIDQVGLLADIYRQSEVAFIGGSFKNKIHSVMEALCAGNIVLFGPYFTNNSEAIEFTDLKLAFFNSKFSGIHRKI